MVVHQDVLLNRVLRSTLSNYAGKGIELLTWVLLTPFILHHLGVLGYGLWTLVGSVVSYGSLLDLGISNAIIKYVAEHRVRGRVAEARAFLSTTLWLYTILGIAIIALAAIIAPFFSLLFDVPAGAVATASQLVVLMGVTMGVTLPGTTALAALQGLHRYDIVSVLTTAWTLISALTTAIVLLLGGGVLAMVAASIPLAIALQGVNFLVVFRLAPDLRFGFRGGDRRLIRAIATHSWALFAVNAAWRVETKTDEVVIGAFMAISAVTPYNLARKLSEAALLLTEQFRKVLLPLASELHAGNEADRLRLLYIVGTRLTLAIHVPLACTLIVLAAPILTIWVGAAYADNAHLVTILLLASLIASSQRPANTVLQGIGRHQPLAGMAICSAIGNLVLSVALVRPFGLTGVAIGTLVPTAIIYLGGVFPYAQRVIGVGRRESWKEMLWPVLAPAVPAVAVLLALRAVVHPSALLPLAAVACAGLLTYLIGYLRVGASELERRTYEDLARGAIHFAEARLGRP